MKTTIQNAYLKAEIKHKGAELSSLWKDGENIIWDIDTKFWDKTSPVLFPTIGALKNDQYEYEGKFYQLPRHGFAREMDFDLLEKTEGSATFSLKFSEETLKIYPFKFELQIVYTLSDNQLWIAYNVINLEYKKLYYSIGAHPAFKIEGNIDEYSLVFDKDENLTTYKLYDNLFSGATEELVLNNRHLKLDYSLFAKDAIVLKNSTTSSLTLLRGEKPILKGIFPDFPYLGIWTKKDAPFICIEPWLGIADNQDASGKLEEKEGIQILEAHSVKSVSWIIEMY